jgi:hydroxymethylbilane synthase
MTLSTTLSTKSLTIPIAARGSLLSRSQVQEILGQLHSFYPNMSFKETYAKTTGDREQSVSLRGRDKTDFFTKEVDELVLQGKVRISIHSAKDLPDPLPRGLCIVAITKCIDPSDVIVMRAGMTFHTLAPGSRIGTSSERREAIVRQLRADLECIDIRGTIDKRLSLLEQREVDGVVIAKAALLRLNITELPMFQLPGQTAPLQGKLAVVAREEDEEMAEIFSVINA